MTAAEVLAQHRKWWTVATCVATCTAPGCDWSRFGNITQTDAAHAAHQIDALNAAGYEIVPLPEVTERDETDTRAAFGNPRRWPAYGDRRTGYVYFEDTDNGDDRGLRAASVHEYVAPILAAARYATTPCPHTHRSGDPDAPGQLVCDQCGDQTPGGDHG